MRILPINRKFIAIALVLIGAVIITVYSFKSYRSYRQWVYIQEQGIEQGAADTGAIRPWMTMRYVSVAYAVPLEYIFAELDISYNHRNSNDTLGHLTHLYQDKAETENPGVPALVGKVGEIIKAYRQNPVATGLNDIRPWMTILYISNSTGVPVDYLFKQLNIAPDNNKFTPLDDLAKEVNFSGGTDSLIDGIKESLIGYEGPQ